MRARSAAEAFALALAAWLSLASSDEPSEEDPPKTEPTYVPTAKACGVNTDCPGFQLSDRCAATEECVTGYCTPRAAVDCSQMVGANPCLVPSCGPTTGQCQLSAIADGQFCQPTDPCQGDGTCFAGTCQSSPQVCDDNNACTTDGCTPGVGCQFTPKPDTSVCDDGTACTVGESCTQGYCTTLGPLDCDDQNPCTSDSCDAVTGCVHTTFPDGYYCDDTSPCSDPGSCQAGVCQTAPIPNGTPCEDYDPCTQGTTCVAGACAGGTPTVCVNDGVAECYRAVCVPTVGCQNQVREDGSGCDPTRAGDPCGLEGLCLSGACQTTKPKPNGTPCSTQRCAIQTCQDDACVFQSYAPPGTRCLLNSFCFYDGQCGQTPGQCDYLGPSNDPVDCDDGDPCTDDACDAQSGCTHTPSVTGCVG